MYTAKKKVEKEHGDGEIVVDDEEERERILKIRNALCHISEERERLLKEQDFIFSAHDHAWKQKFNELAEFAATNGHCDLKGDKSTLSHWVESQRRLYRRKMEGKPSSLSDERIAMLSSIHFSFAPTKVTRSRNRRS